MISELELDLNLSFGFQALIRYPYIKNKSVTMLFDMISELSLDLNFGF